MGVGSAMGLHEARVLSCEPCAEKMMRLVIEAPELAEAIAPGQFMQLEAPGDASHILRIPLSFSHADASAGIVELVFAVVGEGTARLARLAPGDAISVLGPLGHGWRLPEGEGRALLVAGGVGLPPVVACARMLANAGIGFDVVVGAKTAALVAEHLVDALRSLPLEAGCDCQRRVLIATDDGSMGIEGFATVGMEALLAERPYAMAYACGPAPMMAGIVQLAREARLACQVSLERLMACGFGACNCCNVELAAGGYASCCKDGPVFDAEEVAW